MAHITVEDCITQISNRFELIVVAAHRTKQIAAGAALSIERDNDKNTVVALREIAGGKIDSETVCSSLVDLHRQFAQVEPQEEELQDLLEQELTGTQYISDSHARAHMEESAEDEDLAEDDQDPENLSLDEENDIILEKNSSPYEDADIVNE